MANVSFYNDNCNRSYPFVRGQSFIPHATIVDCGFKFGSGTGFIAGQDSMHLTEVRREADQFFFTFRSTAPGLVEKSICFVRDADSTQYVIEYADARDNQVNASLSTTVCDYADDLCGYLVTGRLDELNELLPTDGVLSGSTAVEPALLRDLSRSYARTLNIANADRTRYTAPDGCKQPCWPVPTEALPCNCAGFATTYVWYVAPAVPTGPMTPTLTGDTGTFTGIIPASIWFECVDAGGGLYQTRLRQDLLEVTDYDNCTSITMEPCGDPGSAVTISTNSGPNANLTFGVVTEPGACYDFRLYYVKAGVEICATYRSENGCLVDHWNFVSETDSPPAWCNREEPTDPGTVDGETVDVPMAVSPAQCPVSVAAEDLPGMYVRATCLQGTIRFQEGYNLGITQDAANNSLVFNAIVGGGEGPPCDQPVLYVGETPPTGSSLLEGGVACHEVIRSINGVGGPILQVTGGLGTEVTYQPGQHQIIIDMNTHNMAVCSPPDTSLAESCSEVSVSSAECDCGPA